MKIKNIAFTLTIITANLFSLIISLLIPNTCTQFLCFCLLIFCQLSAYFSDEKKTNYVFPVKLFSNHPIIISAIAFILAFPKWLLSNNAFSGFNFNDIVILPLVLELLLSSIKDFQNDYHFLDSSSPVLTWYPFFSSFLLQISFYYVFFYNSIIKGINPTFTIAEIAHIIHMGFLTYLFTNIAIYWAWLFLYCNKIQNNINTNFCTPKTSIIFTLLYIFISIWSFTNYFKGYYTSEIIVAITLLIFIIAHSLVLSKAKQSKSNRKLKIFNIIIMSLSISLYIIFTYLHYTSFFKQIVSEYTFIIFCIIILIIIAITIIFIGRDNTSK